MHADFSNLPFSSFKYRASKQARFSMWIKFHFKKLRLSEAKVIKTDTLFVSVLDAWDWFPHVKLFHFLCWTAGDSSVSCEWISLEIEHQRGQDRKTYHTVCLPSIVLTRGLMRPNSPRCSNGPIMMEIVTHITMWKLPKSSCSQGVQRYPSHLLWQIYKSEDRSVVIEQLFAKRN